MDVGEALGWDQGNGVWHFVKMAVVKREESTGRLILVNAIVSEMDRAA